MSNKTMSVKGEEVDFDLLKVKSRLQKTEKPLDVKTREDFVHMKRKRRGNSKISEMVSKRLEEEEQKKTEERKKKEDPVAQPEKTREVMKNKRKKKKRKIVKKDDK